MKTIILDGVEYNLTPKARFKPDDWVVYYRNDSSREVLQVYDIRDGRYYFTDNVHFSWSVKECDEKSHLWTTQDAKDGDVLVDSLPFIFKMTDNLQRSYAYGGISGDYTFRVESEGEFGEWTWAQDIKPATKEQRDLLFTKMKEAGYEWDAEKKELKKIESNPAWSEEDELVVEDIEEAVINYWHGQSQEDLLDWLKSLKTRCTWKPSDEQMADLWNMLCECRPADHQLLQDIYYGLKKLKGG